MLFRFSLYGFLKNQRYFEPFLILAFLAKGLTFFEVGALIAFRETTTNLLEIPSGAIADLWGRRRAMIASFVAYLASFLTFGLTERAIWLLPAMFAFSIGEAFRTGTHKAMIFAWLTQQGRTAEKTAVYGYTRSWSKLGSAVSVVIGAVCVFALDDYSVVFLLAAAPCALSIANFLGYPASLDGGQRGAAHPRAVLGHTWTALRDGFRRPALRRLILESMGFEGMFRAAKDYLQPLLAAAAAVATVPFLAHEGLSDIQRSTLLIGPIYLVLHLTSSVASRNAHRVVALARGDEGRAARRLWMVAAALFAMLGLAQVAGWTAASIAAFVALHVLQNVWRPILISRFDTHGDATHAATTLSIESQSQRVATIVLAPLLGAAIDVTRVHTPDGPLWPIGVVGVVIASAALLHLPSPPRGASVTSAP